MLRPFFLFPGLHKIMELRMVRRLLMVSLVHPPMIHMAISQLGSFQPRLKAI